MGWEIEGDINIGVKHPGPSIPGVAKSSIRHEISIFTGEVTLSATASNGNYELLGGTIPHPLVNWPASLSEIQVEEKLGGFKGDYVVRPGVVAGWSIGTDGTAGLRAGLGNKDFNVYIEPSIRVSYVGTATDRLRYQQEFQSSDARDKVAREAIASNSRVNAADNDPLGALLHKSCEGFIL